MSSAEIEQLIRQLDTSSSRSEEDAWQQLKPFGASVAPFLASSYPKFKKWQGRASLVFHSIRYARTSEATFQLGIAALKDKATLVRYRACGILAYSLRKDALPYLQEALSHTDQKTVTDAAAAIDAITSHNHHYFVDRSHSGKSFWIVNDSDRNA